MVQPARNPELREALIAYAQDAIGLIANVVEKTSPPVSEESEWNRVAPDQFALQLVRKTEWWLVLYKLESQLHALASYKAAMSALWADPVIAPQLDTLVGTLGSGASRLDADSITRRCVGGILASADAAVFDHEAFEAAYEELEAGLYAEQVPQLIVAPLTGFRSDAGTIELGEGVEVGAPTDDELRTALRVGLIAAGTHIPMINTDGIGVVRLKWNAPKTIGDEPHTAPGLEDARREGEEWQQLVERVVHTLRLYKEGKLRVSGSMRLTRGFSGHGGVNFQSGLTESSWFIHPTYHVRKRDAVPLRALYDGLGSEGVLNNSSLTGAIRRFGYAGERLRDDDRLIDLSIAAEALFLPHERLELGHKLASRAAWFLRPRGETRVALFRQFRHAYKARGALVHGDVPTKLHLVDGSVATLGTLTAEFEGFVREALIKAISLARERRLPTGPHEWDELTLSVLPRDGKMVESSGSEQGQVGDGGPSVGAAGSADLESGGD